MNRLFGGKPQQQVPPPPPPPPQPKFEQPAPDFNMMQKKAENKTRELSEHITALEREAADLYVKVRNAKGSSKYMYKQRCIQVLKQKKQYEQQLKQYMAHQNTLDTLSFTKDNIKNTMEMGQVMKQTVEQQKAMFQQIDMDALYDMRDQMEDMKFETDYMNELMSRNYDTNVEDIDLDAEMQDIDNDFYQEVMKKPIQQQPIKVPQQQTLQKESGYNLKN